jgi:hypothetical protein
LGGRVKNTKNGGENEKFKTYLSGDRDEKLIGYGR